MSFRTFIDEFVTKTKLEIVVLANSELDNKEKKNKLDETIVAWVNKALDTLPINFVAKWVIKKYIIGNIGILTQAIYDLIKSRIAGITK